MGTFLSRNVSSLLRRVVGTPHVRPLYGEKQTIRWPASRTRRAVFPRQMDQRNVANFLFPPKRLPFFPGNSGVIFFPPFGQPGGIKPNETVRPVRRGDTSAKIYATLRKIMQIFSPRLWTPSLLLYRKR